MPHSATASTPMRAPHWLPAPLRSPVELLIGAGQRWSDERGSQMGAAIAFYTMFALAPLLVIAIAIAGAVFGLDAARGQIVGEINGLIGTTAAKWIEALLESAWREKEGTRAGLIGGVTLLVGATGVFTELRRALNAIARFDPPPSVFGALIRARLVGLALVLGFGFLAIASLLLSAAVQALSGILGRIHMGQWSYLGDLAVGLDVLVSAGVITTAFAALLRWLPDRPPSWRAVWLGAACCSVLFTVGKYFIGLYLAHTSTASSYGAAGSFVVVMIWVYYTAQILLFGGALAISHDELRRLSAKPPSRVA